MNPLILIVDDDPGIRSALSKLLRAEGWDTTTAKDGHEGLEKFWEIQPDLMLLDIVMPGLSGLEVCKLLKDDQGSRLTPIVLVTGLAATEDRVRGIDAGADDFLIKPFERAELIARVRSLLRLKRYTDELERAESVLYALARSIEGKDPYTEGHCERLSVYATKLGARIGLDEASLTALRRAGIVHDLGKIAVPDAVLLKPGALTSAERSVMQTHPVVGERICEGLQSFGGVRPIIRHHHERCDGSGYPDGLAGDEIPLTARVLNVVDIYDALTTDRPYRPAAGHDEAVSIMQSEVDRGFIDSDVFAEFGQMVQENACVH